MDLVNSRNVNNRIKKTSIITAVIFHTILALLTFGLSLALLAIVGTGSLLLLNRAIDQAKSRDYNFNKVYPFDCFGQTLSNFQYIFHHSYSFEKDIYAAIEKELKTKTPITSLKSVAIIDADPDLKNSEQRSFIKAELEPTSRGTAITLILNQSNFGAMRSIQWRVLAAGYVDKNRQFNFIAYSLLTVFAWIIPYLRGEESLLNRVRRIYPAAYNHMDMATQLCCLQEVVFDATIAELDKNGIDTADLKVQKRQMVNINLSEGKLNIGNRFQRVRRKIAVAPKGAQA